MRSVTFTIAQAAVVIGLFFVQPQSALAQAAAPQVGFVNLNRVTNESTEGKAANARLGELRDQKRSELEARNTQAQGEVSALNQQLIEAQEKLQQGANVISADASANLQRDISRLQVDIQRKTQDSQADLARLQEDAEIEVQTLSRELQIEFEAVLTPAIDQLAAQKGLSMIVNAQSLVWANSSLDLTQDLIDLIDSPTSSTSPAAPPQ